MIVATVGTGGPRCTTTRHLSRALARNPPVCRGVVGTGSRPEAVAAREVHMEVTIRRLEIDLEDGGFAEAKAAADAAAAGVLTDPICLAWVDAVNGRESPPHADCHESCDTPGAVEYARNRGAELEVVVGSGRYIFCYRSPGEFADL